MPSIEELGKRVKAKYPGTYDDLPDAELGVRVRGKFPGAYDDFTNDTPIAAPAVPSITPKAAPVAPPMMSSTVDPFAPKQDWLPSKPKPAPQLKPSTLAAPEDAIVPQAPGKIPQTVEMSPIGQTNAPVPGRIPDMERLGGAAPGVPMAPNALRPQAPAPLPPPIRQQNVQIQADEIPPPPAPVISMAKSGPVPQVVEGPAQTFSEGLGQAIDYTGQQVPKVLGAIPKVQAMMRPGQTQVSPDEAAAAAQVVNEPLVKPSLMIPDDGREDSTRELIRGAIEGVEGLLTPETLTVIGTTGGIAKAAQTVASPAVRGALKSATTALSLYFTGQAGKGAYEAGKTAYELHQKGDDEGAARYLGLASVDALFAVLGVAHAASEAVGGAKSFKEGYERGQRRRAAVDADAEARFQAAQEKLNAEAFEPIPGEPGKFRLKQNRPQAEAPKASETTIDVRPQPDPLQQAIESAPPLPQEAKPVGKAAVEPGDDGVSYKIEALPNGEFRARLVDSEGNPFGPYWTMPDRESAELKGVALLNKHRYGIDDAPTPVFTAKKELSEKELDEITADSLSNQNLPSIKIDELKNGKFKVYLADGSGDSIGTSWTYADRQAAEKKGNEMLQEHISSNPPTETNTIPAPGPREEVVQPEPVDAAAPVAGDKAPLAPTLPDAVEQPAPKPGERVEADTLGKRRDSLFPSEDAADSFISDQMLGTKLREGDFEVRREGDGWRIYRRSTKSGEFHPWTYFEDGKPVWRSPNKYSKQQTRLEEQAGPPAADEVQYSESDGKSPSGKPKKTIIAKTQDGYIFGDIGLIDDGDGYRVDSSGINKPFRGVGLGKELYRKAIEAARSAGKKYIESAHSVSESAERVWKSLGAERISANDAAPRYRITLDQPKESNAPLSPEAPPPPGPVEAAAPQSTKDKIILWWDSKPESERKELLSVDGPYEYDESDYYNLGLKEQSAVESLYEAENPGSLAAMKGERAKGSADLYKRIMDHVANGGDVYISGKKLNADQIKAIQPTTDAYPAIKMWGKRTTGEYIQLLNERVAPPAPAPVEAPAPAPVVRDAAPEAPGPVEDGPPTWAKAVKALNGVFGRRSPAKTARGYKVDTDWAAVPLGSLRISNTDSGEVNPEFPGQLQPRQRDRKSSDEQIQTIIDEFDPDQVAESYIATDGAPIVGEEDGAVESGNGRSMAIRRIYERFPDKASKYRQWMIDNAERFGLDANSVAQIDRPVLVRVRRGLPEGVTRADFGRDANERTTAGMSPAEQSAIDAKAMDSSVIEKFVPNEDGSIDTMANVPFVTAFIEKVVPVSERGTMRSGDGMLSTAGIRRIQNAIFAKAYNDRGMIERMSEDPDDNIKSVVGAMVSAAPRFISIKAAIESGDLHNLDISKDLTAAASTLSRLRVEKMGIDDYLKQEDMFGRPEIQDAILTTLRDLGRSKAKFGDILNQYADAVEAAGNPKQIGMFGPAEVPTPLGIWSSIVEREQADARGTQDDAAPGPVDAGSAGVGEGSRKGSSKKARRAEGEQGPAAPEPVEQRASESRSPLGNTVEKTKDGLQETLVTDLEARESQIAAKNDRNRPIAEVPFSLVAEEPPAPTGPDERQSSMFGGDDEVVGYAPKKPRKNGAMAPPEPPGRPADPNLRQIIKDNLGLDIETGQFDRKPVLAKFTFDDPYLHGALDEAFDAIGEQQGVTGSELLRAKLSGVFKPLENFYRSSIVGDNPEGKPEIPNIRKEQARIDAEVQRKKESSYYDERNRAVDALYTDPDAFKRSRPSQERAATDFESLPEEEQDLIATRRLKQDGFTPDEISDALENFEDRVGFTEDSFVESLADNIRSMRGDKGDGEVAAFRPGLPTPGKKTAAKPAGRKGQMTSRGEIVRDLSSFLNDIPIRVGGIKERAAGIFKTRQNVIRTQKPLDLPTIAHEIGHAIHKYLWRTDPKNINKLDSRPLRPFKKELGPLDYDHKQQRVFEGFAEYIRLRLTEPGEAQRRAPHFHAWFNKHIEGHPDLVDVLNKAEERIGQWYKQSGTEKIAASIQKKAPEKKRWASWADRQIVQSFDDLHLVRKIEEEMDEAGVPPQGAASAYELMRMLSSSGQKAEYMIRKNTFIDSDTDPKLGASMAEIVKPLADRKPADYNPRWKRYVEKNGVVVKGDGLDDLRVYISARRFKNYHENDLETGFTDDEINEAIRSTETPAVKKAAEGLSDFSKRVIDYAVDKGAITEQQRDAMHAKNEFYAPIWRVMGDEGQQAREHHLSRNLLATDSPIRKRKGSVREWTDPIENFIHNTHAIVSFADRFEAQATLAKRIAMSQNMGLVLESGISPKMVKTTFNLEELRPVIAKAMEAEGFDISDVDLGVMASIYRMAHRPNAKNGEVLLPDVEMVDGKPMTNGKMATYFMDRDLAESLNFRNTAWNYEAYRAAATVADALRLGATGIGPDFVVRNPFRDTVEAAMNSDNGFKPVVDTILGSLEIIKNPEMVNEMVRGGYGGSFQTPQRGNSGPHFDRLLMNPVRYVMRHPMEVFSVIVDALKLAGEHTELATRAGEYRLAKKKGRPYKKRVMAARDVSIDFNMMGLIGRIINPISAYFSATMNGNYRAYRNLFNKKTRWRTIRRGIQYFTLPTLALWLMNKDDPNFEELPDYQKTFFWNIPTKYMPQHIQDVMGPFITIPRAHIYGLIFGSLPERAFDAAYKKNPEKFSSAAKAFLADSMGVVIPNIIPNVVLTPVELMTNWKFFRAQQIESDRDRDFPAEFRSHSDTTWTAKKIAAGLNAMGMPVSPLKVEHAIYSLSASAGRATLTGAEALFTKKLNKVAPEAADIPVLRAFATHAVPNSPASIRRLYDRLDELTKIAKAASDAEKNPHGRAAGARKMTDEEKKELQKLMTAARGHNNKNSLAALNQRIHKTEYDENLTPQEKKRDIIRLKKIRVNVAREAIGLTASYKID